VLGGCQFQGFDEFKHAGGIELVALAQDEGLMSSRRARWAMIAVPSAPTFAMAVSFITSSRPQSSG
jgi:hypothetical protein